MQLPATRKSSSKQKFLQCKMLLSLSQIHGCMYFMHVTHFEDCPKALLIKWIERNHHNKDDAICHGLDDPTTYEANANIVPKISTRSCSYIEQMLRLGMSSRTIIQAHMDEIPKSIGKSTQKRMAMPVGAAICNFVLKT